MSKDLRVFLDDLQERLPYDFVRIEKSVSPKQFEVTALLQHFENQKKFPVLFFEKPLDLNGKPSAFPLLSNVFATRQRCALSLGMKANEGDLPLSLEYARREDTMLAPVTIPRSEAPVKQVIKRGDEANIYELARGSASCHGPGAVHRHDAGDEGSGRRLLQYRLPAQHGEGTAQARPAHVAAAQLANPSQERREKPADAGGHRHQPSSGILFGLAECLAVRRRRLRQGRRHYGRRRFGSRHRKLSARISWCRRTPRW